MPADRDLTPGDWSVLALVGERPTHGWALAVQLARGGEVGSIWALGRPLVYHGLERLEQAALIRAAGLERGARGPHRVVYEITPKGRKAVAAWLARPVDHVRDIRSLFLLKVVLSQRAGLDVQPLLVAQRAVILPFVAWLEAQLDDVGVLDGQAEATQLYFKLETAQTIVRFIDRMLDDLARRPAPARRRTKQG